MAADGDRCAHGGGLLRRRCGRTPTESTCVYCGQAFCELHGERGEDFEDVCTRVVCQAKRDDVRAHRVWRDRQRAANQLAQCAIESCGERMSVTCSQCDLQCCEEHVGNHTITSRRTSPPSQVRVVLCDHCKERRSLWD